MKASFIQFGLLLCGVAVTLASCLLGCSGSSTGEPAATGGASGTGGDAGTGGAGGTGGASGSGGASGTGGDSGSGGAAGTGGVAGTGGGGGGPGGAGGAGGMAGNEFSFFVISLEAIKAAGGDEGLGGDLGGLAGADALCQQAAEKVGSTGKVWHAFLSVTNDGNGNPVHAIERIGTGPWYNAKGLLLANDIAGLLHVRPEGSTEIVYDDGFNKWPFNQCLTDEYGACVLSYGDSHDTLTGSGADGKLHSQDMKYTCNDWTSSGNTGSPAIGHSWPRHLKSTQAGEASWVFTPNHFPQGCSKNINLNNTMEKGVGGDGGYGAWYCFAVTGS